MTPPNNKNRSYNVLWNSFKKIAYVAPFPRTSV